MANKFREYALTLALDGNSEEQAKAALLTCKATPAQIADAIAYTYHGEGQVRQKQVKANAKRRARKAATVIIQFYDKADMATSASDAMADIMHLAARSRTGFDFEEALDLARRNFEAELIDGEG